jgi:carboxymethylenebutenolidase
LSVLKGEGTYPILFQTSSIPVRTLTHTAYVARPDVADEWPTIMIIGGAKGLSSPVRDLCRRLARHGLAAVAPDLYGGAAVPDDREKASQAFQALRPSDASRVLGDVGRYLEAGAHPWDTDESGFGVIGIQEGAVSSVAVAFEFGSPLVLMAPNLRESSSGVDADFNPLPVPPGVLDSLGEIAGPLLGMIGREDEESPITDVMQARDIAPHSQWVIYDHVGHDFLDDNEAGFDQPAFTDALDRTVEFFAKNL